MTLRIASRSRIAATLEPILARCGNPHVIPVCGERGHRRLTTARPGAGLPEPLPSPADLATLQYTGGTTGVPKGVDCPHSAVAVNIAQRDALVPKDRDGERILCAMPLYHTYAVAMCLHNAANCGGTLVVLPRFDSTKVLETLQREQITVLSGAPVLEGYGQSESGPALTFNPRHGLRKLQSVGVPVPQTELQIVDALNGERVLGLARSARSVCVVRRS